MRVLAAMSGGDDSAVAAALMRDAGHEVIGATLQLYDAQLHDDRRHDGGAPPARRGACCAGRDIHDARRAADRLAIPHYVIDAERRFAETVVEPFAESYARGETPVPCIRCNQGVKFTDLLGLARELGCDAMATGHYVRRVEGPDGPELHRPVAAERDQSWFLFATTREQLDFLRFPLGALADKRRVRAEAERLGLASADKPDSQDMCFAPGGSHAAIVGRIRPAALVPGDIVDERGEVVGRHEGLARYTPGQRKRLGAAASVAGEPRAVRRIEPASNRILVGPRDRLGTRAVPLRETNWLVPIPPEGRRCTVRLRARDADRPALILSDAAGRARVLLDEEAIAAPGQACVAADGSRILGGGFIARAETPGAEMPAAAA